MQNNSKPLTSMVYDYVYGEITNGNITPNDILTESSLVNQLKVSKSPVREALILLCEENVLQAIPRTGYRPIQITPDQIAHLIEARYALEPFMLAKAWPVMDDVKIAQIEHCRELCKKDELVNTSIQDNWRRNIDFHTLLAGFSGNQYLLDALKRTLKTCARASNQYFRNVRGIPRGDDDLHDAILRGLKERDYEKTLAALNEDLRQII